MVSNNRGALGITDLGATWEAGRGNDMLETVGWGARRRRGAAGKSGVRQTGEPKE